MRLQTLPSLLLITLSLSSFTTAARNSKSRTLLSTIRTLTLHADQLTTSRRLPPIPQLRCVGGSAQHLYNVDTLRCTNQGASYSDESIQWTCTASLPPEFKLGSTNVICEGYEDRDDPYVLAGSCGVEYRLVLTEKGEERFGDGEGSTEKGAGRAVWAGRAFWGVFVAVLAWIVYSAFFAGRRHTGGALRRGGGNNNNPWGWGGGGGPGNDDDPPPPYDPRPPQSKPSAPGQQEGWRPGFWTGALGGAAAGYLAGNNRGQASPPSQQWRNMGNGEGSSRGSGGSGSSSRSSASSSPSFSSTRYESMGFGSTSRR
ncbi:hypothetical protein MMC20_004795 [Loxospora ochrophaea]|nr:hypothetical protein [Loxospora ochrophaea]